MTIRAIDLFAGAGGTSTGLALAAASLGSRVSLAAVNHWPIAVETHALNHPWAEHHCAAIDSLDPQKVARGKVDLLVASPECTHHSNARGGKPINDQSRASAWCVVRWAEALQPRVVLVENVREFQTWGPLTLHGRPMKGREGETFEAWLGALKAIGYRTATRVLNCADYGDATTRRRLFVLAWRGNCAAPWPIESHADQGTADLFASRRPWRAAREIIDWSIAGRSIFGRRKPLAEATLSRIADGLRRFGGEASRAFIAQLTHGGRLASLDAPLPTITCANGGEFALIEPFVLGQQSGAIARPVSEPLPTLATSGAVALIEPFLVSYYGTGTASAVSAPVPTITTKDRFALVEPRIADIRLRMLAPHELAAAMSFPSGYRFAGTRGESIKQIGNAVPVSTARALCDAILREALGVAAA